jgi:hypothetical protein
LRNAALKTRITASFTNQFNAHPAISIWRPFSHALWNGACPDLTHNSKEINISKWNAHEASDLANPIGLASYKADTCNRFVRQRHTNRGAADITNETYKAIALHHATTPS